MLNNDSANNIQSIHVALSKKLKQNNRTPVSRCRNIILHEPTHACDSSERDAGVSIWWMKLSRSNPDSMLHLAYTVDSADVTAALRDFLISLENSAEIKT